MARTSLLCLLLLWSGALGMRWAAMLTKCPGLIKCECEGPHYECRTTEQILQEKRKKLDDEAKHKIVSKCVNSGVSSPHMPEIKDGAGVCDAGFRVLPLIPRGCHGMLAMMCLHRIFYLCLLALVLTAFSSRAC